MDYMRSLDPDQFDLVLGSPPYEDQRWYGDVGFRLRGQDWVDWMVDRVGQMVRVLKPLCVCLMVVGHGTTDDYRWSATPALLLADLHRAGLNLRSPPLFRRVGIPGSGEPDWLRADYEVIVAVQKGRGRIPWSNNRATGTRPKYGPGGELSYRMASGARVNQWGGTSGAGGGTVRRNGKRQGKQRPSHESRPVQEGVDLFGQELVEPGPSPRTMQARDARKGGDRRPQHYKAPALANPGTVFQERYTAEEVAAYLTRYESGDILDGKVGGNHMGHPLAHKNEAPYPLWLADALVRSYCPPGGLVYDPFCGSGTTCHAAVENGRRCVTTDVRPDQADLAAQRLRGVTPRMIVESDVAHAERVRAEEEKKATRGAQQADQA